MGALGDQLRAAFSGSDVKVEVYDLMQVAPSTPAIDIYPADPFREKESAGFGQISGAYMFTVRARIDVADHEASQDILLAFMDDEDDLSVANALLEDQTLAGNASSVDVDGPSGYIRYIEVDRHADLLGVEWKVRLLPAYS